MNLRTYTNDAIRTESRRAVNLDGDKSRLLHAAIGLSTESGELLDAMKKHLFYGKPLDEVNLAEELGDLCWYIAIACDALDVDWQAILETNIAKLRKRYPEKFDEVRAQVRDLEGERKILEGDAKGGA